MNNINESIAHITCNNCGKQWQVLNEEETDWDEQLTAEQYHSKEHNCELTQ
jgi:Fe2+ or Zn2+ uptake regulation protein